MKIKKLAIITLVSLTSLVGLASIVAFFGLWIFLLAYIQHPHHKLYPHTPERNKLADNNAAYHHRLKREPFYTGTGSGRGVMLFYDVKKGAELTPNYVAAYALDERDIKDDNIADIEAVAHRFAASDLKKYTIISFYDLKPEEEKDLLPKDPEREDTSNNARDREDDDEHNDSEAHQTAEQPPSVFKNPIEFVQQKKREVEEEINHMNQAVYMTHTVPTGGRIKESDIELRKIEISKDSEKPVRDLMTVIGAEADHTLEAGHLLIWGDFTATNYGVFTTKFLLPGTVLKPEDLEVKEIAWDLRPTDAIPDLNYLIGKKLVHGIPKNRVVTRWDFGKP